MTNTRAVFFLRAYNDTDHLTPVIWKWATTTGLPSTVVMRTGKETLQDYRIQFISKLPGVKVIHISDLFLGDAPANSDEPIPTKAQNRSFVERATNKVRRWLNLPVSSTPSKKNIDLDRIREMVDALFSEGETGIVVIDWVSLSSLNRAFAKATIEAARDRGIANIALPHGDSPYFNKMFKLQDINYESVEHFGNNPTDVVVVPNPLTAERYTPFRSDSQLKVIGSARYNQEWMDILKTITPKYVNPASDGKLKVVMFLRSPVFPIFWEEVITAVRICTQFPDVYLVVKHHTRGGRRDNIKMREHLELSKLNTMQAPNLEVVYTDTHSGSLLEWADAVLDLGTSISFEAVRLNMPLLALEYLHGNLSTVAHYIPGVALQYKDQLYDEIIKLRSDATHKLYAEDDRQNFISQVIDYPDNNVLKRYINTMLEQMK